MKKNKMMRLASLLLVAVLLTTSIIGGTFAKYVTTAEGSDSARVATWGFKAEDSEIALTDLFETAYDKNVQGAADVIAPGTTNSAPFAFKFEGQEAAPEVAYTFVVSTDGSSIAADIENNANIQWKLDTNEWGTWDEMIADIEALDGDESFDAGELPAGFTANGAHTIAWQWIFEDAAVDADKYTVDGVEMNQDEYDTYMGNQADLAEVSIGIKITATQVNE